MANHKKTTQSIVRSLICRSKKSKDSQQYLGRIFIPLGIGQAIASIESLALSFDEYKKDGYLRGFASKDLEPGTRFYRIARILDHHYTPKLIAATNLMAATGLLFNHQNRKIQIASSAVLGATTKISELRTPYGRDGADQMSGIIMQYRILTSLIPQADSSDHIFMRVVNFQAAMSYTASGLSKTIGKSWILGTAVAEVLETESYGKGPLARVLKQHPLLCKLMTWLTVLWETGFIVIYFLPEKWAKIALSGVKAFHYGIAATMELPRFVWGFTGAHGAIEYVIDKKEAPHSIEKYAILLVLAAILVSAVNAAEDRKIDRLRRMGPKGSEMLRPEKNEVIEYTNSEPAKEVNKATAPVIIMESGLGYPFETWNWLESELRGSCRVIRYHRGNYGLSKTRWNSARIVKELISNVPSGAPIFLVAHSIGSLSISECLMDPEIKYRVDGVVLVDGTNAENLSNARHDIHQVSTFLQSQVVTMIAAVLGAYKWAPNSVERQAKFKPDEQFGYKTFIFHPRNIVHATKEYFSIRTDGAVDALRQIEEILVFSSDEHLKEMKDLTSRIDAKLVHLKGSSHRTILTTSEYSRVIGNHILEWIDEGLA